MMITILMSTYNGVDYLSEQLDSILAQSVKDWHLVVRDDGSVDGTWELLQQYAVKDLRIEVVRDGKNRGAKGSFEVLLASYGTGEYIAFADQDDVWLPDKLQECLSKIQQAEQKYGTHTPIVVHTDLIVTDEALSIISESFWRYAYIKPVVLNRRAEYLAICNSVTGCTMLFNQAARKISLPFGEKALMHDSVVAVRVRKGGGYVLPVYHPTMYYRQHGDNTLGAVKYHLWRSVPARYKEAKEHYHAYHPEIFAGVWLFIYWKLRCFFEEHIRK